MNSKLKLPKCWEYLSQEQQNNWWNFSFKEKQAIVNRLSYKTNPIGCKYNQLKHFWRNRIDVNQIKGKKANEKLESLNLLIKNYKELELEKNKPIKEKRKAEYLKRNKLLIKERYKERYKADINFRINALDRHKKWVATQFLKFLNSEEIRISSLWYIFSKIKKINLDVYKHYNLKELGKCNNVNDLYDNKIYENFISVFKFKNELFIKNYKVSKLENSQIIKNSIDDYSIFIEKIQKLKLSGWKTYHTNKRLYEIFQKENSDWTKFTNRIRSTKKIIKNEF